MKLKITNEYITGSRIAKDITIETPYGDVMINKWSYWNDNEYDTDYEIIYEKGNIKIYDKLTEEEQEDFTDFVNDIELTI